MSRINDFDNLDDLVTQKIIVSLEDYERLLEELDKPSEPSEGLIRLFNNKLFSDNRDQ